MIETSKDKKSAPDENPLVYRPILYTLDLFLGPVDLGIANKWEPKPERRVAFYYSKLLLLAGWILIPIALAILVVK